MSAPNESTVAGAAPSLALGGVMVLLVAIGVRVLSPFDPMPAWSGDPLTIPVPIVGITPRGSLILDAAMLLGTALVVIGMQGTGRGVRLWEVLLFALGAAGAAWHAARAPSDRLDHLLMGSAWTGAMAAGLGASLASRDRQLRGLLAAGLIGIFTATVLKGVLQVTTEHAETLLAFRRDREAFLGSHGWTSDSPMALAYERRLSHPEATGYFGLANVYASAGAACSVALLGLVLPLIPRLRELAADRLLRWWLMLLVPCVASAGTLWLAWAKGGFAAAALGLLLLALAWLVSRSGMSVRARAVLGSVVGVGSVVGTLGAVVLRGGLGERLGELSVLFRWFYITTAAKIFGQHPVAGVGPAGFKNAYMLEKPPISPEDVASPHSVLFDFSATLGVFGVSWCVLLLFWITGAGRALLGTHGKYPAGPIDPVYYRRTGQWLVLALVAPVGLAGMMERELASPENALTRLGSVALGGLTALAVRWVLNRRDEILLRIAVPAGALALAAHAQIEMTASTTGSAAWMMAMLGLGAGFAWRPGETRSGSRERVAWFAVALGVIAAAAALLPGVHFPRVARWEFGLRGSAELVTPVGELGIRLRMVGAGDSEQRRHIGALIDRELEADGLMPPRDERIPAEARLAALRRNRIERAIPGLELASRAQPDHTGTMEALTRLRLILAEDMLHGTQGQSAARERAASATDHADRFARSHPTAVSWGWSGTILDARAALFTETPSLRNAIGAWEQAAALAPHAVMYPVQIARACARLGDFPKARVWATQALVNDTKARLDPLMGLSDAVRREMAGLAADPANTPSNAPGAANPGSKGTSGTGGAGGGS